MNLHDFHGLPREQSKDRFLQTSPPLVTLDSPLLRLLLPLWGVAFVAGFVMTACHH